MSAFTRKGDFWSGLVLVVLGAYIVKEAWSWEYLSIEGPGPGFFPLWYGGAMIVLSLLLVVGAVLKTNDAPSQRRVSWVELLRVLTCWVAFAVCIALLNVLGFVLSFALMTWFIIALLFRKSQRLAIGLAVIGAVSFYALFSFALGVALPAGFFF